MRNPRLQLINIYKYLSSRFKRSLFNKYNIMKVFSLKCILQVVMLKNAAKYVKFSGFNLHCKGHESTQKITLWWKILWDVSRNWTEEKIWDFLIKLCLKKLLLFLSISSRKKDKMCQSKNVGYLTVVLFYLIFAKIAKKGGKWEPGSKFRYKHSIIKW